MEFMTFRSAETRYGTIAIPEGPDLIGDSLLRYGEWAQNEIDDLLQLIHPRDTVIDAGACFGTHTLAFAYKVGPGGRVVAIEASSDNFALLEQTVRSSSSAQLVQLVNAAVTEGGNARIGMLRPEGNAGGNRLEATADGSVTAMSIDELDLPAIDFIKLDIEGMEAAALRGARRSLGNLRPVVYCEVNSISAGGELLSELQRLGYSCFGHVTSPFNPNNFNCNATNIFGEGSECGLLAVPTERVTVLSETIQRLQNLFETKDADDVALLLMHKQQYRVELMQRLGPVRGAVVPLAHNQLEGEESDLSRLRQVADKKTAVDNEVEAIRPEFDETYYVALNPGVATSGLCPVKHFCQVGWKERRDPTPWFSVAFYLDTYPDVASAGVNPFKHYLSFGRGEGRHCRPPDTDDRIAQEVMAIASEFDETYYLSQNPDVATSGLSPAEHFCQVGWRERRDPTPWFSVSYYLDAYPDVVGVGVNPFKHYLNYGRSEGRLTQRPATLLQAPVPLEETVRNWHHGRPDNLLLSQHVANLLRERRTSGDSRLLISVSHDDYTCHAGGVQHCIQLEEKAAASERVAYLNLHPWQGLPRLVHEAEDPDPIVSLVLSGNHVGHVAMSVLVDAVARSSGEFTSVSTAVHQLLGHSPEWIAKLLEASSQNGCWIWLHDFFTMCPSPHLRRNNIAFCHGPELESNACSLCIYGEERAMHLPRMRRLFQTFAAHVVAPSNYVAELWSRQSHLPYASLSVLPHMTIRFEAGHVLPSMAGEEDRPITIAFAGVPAVHKGWLVFSDLANAVCKEGLPATFLYLGSVSISSSIAEAVHVQVSGDDPDAMMRTVRKREVDFLFQWSLVPETFSLTTYEALAGGALVITNPGTGNVADVVRSSGRGDIFPDLDAVLDALRDGRLFALTRKFRNSRKQEVAIVSRSKLTLDLLNREASE